MENKMIKLKLRKILSRLVDKMISKNESYLESGEKDNNLFIIYLKLTNRRYVSILSDCKLRSFVS